MTTLSHRESFRTLGLPTSADQVAVRRAFHRLVKKHHPDLQRGSTDRSLFIRIVQAYTTLQRVFREQDGWWTQPLANLGNRLALRQPAVRFTQLANDLLRRMSLPFHQESLWPVGR